MIKNKTTLIFCYDDHRGYSEDVRKRFSDANKYSVESFQNREEFINTLEKVKELKNCKVAILGLNDSEGQPEMIEHLSMQIKKIDRRTGLIILGPPDKMELIKKTIKFNIDAYIPKNGNSVLRIHNIVKKLMSEYGIEIFRKRRNFSFYVLIVFFLISILFMIAARLRLPLYF